MGSPPAHKPPRLHVLYAVAHDFRHDLDVPSLDSIADDRGARFQLAMSQAPYCGPSRNSFFTGRRPSVTRVHTFDKDDVSTYAPLMPEAGESRAPWTALPHAFADAGYQTYGAGITVENFRDSGTRCPGCWTDGYFVDWGEDVDFGTFDASVANASIAWLLRRYYGSNESVPPFFLMPGFHGGHKPWPTESALHAQYGTNTYTLAASDLRLWEKPRGTGAFASPEQSRLENKHNWPAADGGEVSVQLHEAYRRGYLVNARRFDDAFGRVLATVRRLGLWTSTIVCFHGDHGLSLGEYGVTGKGKLLDVDVRVPWVIRAPQMPAVAAGSRRTLHSIVELIDVFPTLCDLAAIRCPRRRHGGGAAAHSTSSTGHPSLADDDSQQPWPPFEDSPPLDGTSRVASLLSTAADSLDPLNARKGSATMASVATTAVEGACDGLAEGYAIATYPRCTPLPPKLTLSCNSLPAAAIAIMGTSVVPSPTAERLA